MHVNNSPMKRLPNQRDYQTDKLRMTCYLINLDVKPPEADIPRTLLHLQLFTCSVWQYIK